MEEEYTITFNKKELLSIIEGEWSDVQGFEPEVLEKIRAAMCPEGHTEEIVVQNKVYYKTGTPYFWAFGHCINCLDSLWGITHADVKEQKYRMYFYDGREAIIFKFKDKDDPRKVVFNGKEFVGNPRGE